MTFIPSISCRISLGIGASISINGVCLTLVKFSKRKRNNDLYFDISPETLKITNLLNSKVGDFFNIENLEIYIQEQFEFINVSEVTYEEKLIKFSSVLTVDNKELVWLSCN